jgi:RimJ/RimL family protein N-acetyltransferase
MLAGAAVRLRPARTEDLDWLVAASGTPSAFGEFEPFFVGEAESLRRRFEQDGLLSEDFTRLVIEDRSGRRVGLAGVDEVDLHSRVARISATILEPAERGKGLGTDAHRVLVSYLFLHRGILRIEAFVAAGNIAARAVLRRLGFVEEGVLRSRVFAHGQRHDVVVAGLLYEDWSRRTGTESLPI